MLRPLRATACLVLWSGCEAAPTTPAALPTDPWPAPELTLTSTGSEPFEVVRIPVGAAPEASVAWSSTFTTTATRGSVTTHPMVIQQDRTLAITTAPGTGDATFDFTVVDAKDSAQGGAPVDPAVATAMVGRAGRWTATDRCVVQTAGVDTSNAGAAEPHLPGLLRSAVELCPVLPEEPLGIGARWTTRETRSGGRTVETAWVLAYRDDHQVALTFQTHDPTDGSMAEGRVALDRHHPVPMRFDASGRSSRTRPDPERPSGTLVWTTQWEMHATRTVARP